jgi:hypothetical protein
MLAALAIVLMLVAPLLSRWQQMQPRAMAADAGALCTSRGLQWPLSPVATAAPHAGAHDADGAMLHEHACDYCLLAARLLPWLAVLLVLLPWLRHHARPALPRTPAVAAGVWRAHAARGPPLFS